MAVSPLRSDQPMQAPATKAINATVNSRPYGVGKTLVPVQCTVGQTRASQWHSQRGAGHAPHTTRPVLMPRATSAKAPRHAVKKAADMA